MFRLDNSRLSRLVCTFPDDIQLIDDEMISDMIISGLDIARIKLIDDNPRGY